MRLYRVFMDDCDLSFIVEGTEIESEYSTPERPRLKYGFDAYRTSDSLVIRFIRDRNGDLLNVDHITRIMPMEGSL